MQSMKETTANVAASAKAGMEKTKATTQEKVERLSSHDPVQKQMATEKKEERKAAAELNKLEAREHNAAARQAAKTQGVSPEYTTGGPTGTVTGPEAHSYSPATETPGYPMEAQQMSTMPAQTTGQPYGGMVEEGVVRTKPSGLPGEHTGHNTRVEGTGYGTGTRADQPRFP